MFESFNPNIAIFILLLYSATTFMQETTFITSGEMRDGGYDVRIFTPQEEVPFAGHPTLGTVQTAGTVPMVTCPFPGNFPPYGANSALAKKVEAGGTPYPTKTTMDAMRGAILHSAHIVDEEVVKYNIITPTVWNFFAQRRIRPAGAGGKRPGRDKDSATRPAVYHY